MMAKNHINIMIHKTHQGALKNTTLPDSTAWGMNQTLGLDSVTINFLPPLDPSDKPFSYVARLDNPNHIVGFSGLWQG